MLHYMLQPRLQYKLLYCHKVARYLTLRVLPSEMVHCRNTFPGKGISTLWHGVGRHHALPSSITAGTTVDRAIDVHIASSGNDFLFSSALSNVPPVQPPSSRRTTPVHGCVYPCNSTKRFLDALGLQLEAAHSTGLRQCHSSAAGPSSSFSDITSDHWMYRWLPPAAVPYALLGRWDRPIGTWLLLWPCLWSIGLSAGPGHLPDVRLCALFTLGAFMMRGAGCTINDIWDRDFDRQVERTRHRPLASGALNVKQALAFLSAQLSVSLGVLVQLPPAAIATGLVSTPLWALYPLAKRFTDWPQAVLGIAINWGVLLGSVAVHGQPDWQMVLPLYLASFAWTLHYDTIYAHQDAKDDARAGVRSSALALGKRTKPFLIGCGVVCIGGIGAAGAASGEAALLMPLSAGALHLAWQTRTLDLNSRESCLRLFRSNRDFGAIVFAAIVACKLISLASDGGDGGGSSSGAGSLHSGSSEGGSGGSGSADGGDDGGSSSSHIGSGRGRGDMNEKRAHSSAEHVDTEDTC